MVRPLDEADLADRVRRALQDEPESGELESLLQPGWLSDHARLSYLVDELLGALMIRADFTEGRIESQHERDLVDLFDTLNERRIDVEDSSD